MKDSARQTEFAVRVSRLLKSYRNGTEATRGIDFIASRGESIAVLGANGAGKTTFLRQLTTELKPSSGAVEIFGIDAVKSPNEAKSLMGVTPQEAGVFETLTVRQHLELFGRLKGLDKSAAREETAEILGALELETETKRRVGELSGGQRRRVLIGLALLGKPPLLILDEPTSGLDPVSRRAVWRFLRDATEAGATLIFSTHYLEEAEQLSQRIAFIKDGKIIADGTLTELRARVPQRYRISFGAENSITGEPHTIYFDSFGEAQSYAANENLSEYQIAASSLEDVYFSLVGERLKSENGSPNGAKAKK